MARTARLLLISLLAAYLWPVAAMAGNSPVQYFYEALLDTDSDTGTGGPVTVVQGTETPHTISGIDYIVRAYVGSDVSSTSGPVEASSLAENVIYREVLKWDGSGFVTVDLDVNEYPLGTDGSTVMVEWGAPWADIGAPTGTIRAVFHATRNAVGSDYTSAFDFSLRGAPAASSIGLLALALLLLAAGGLALSRRRGNAAILALAVLLATAPIARAVVGIVLDGNFDDWAGIAPAVTDVPGDSSLSDPAEDILAGYVAVQGTDVFFRVDVAGQPQPI